MNTESEILKLKQSVQELQRKVRALEKDRTPKTYAESTYQLPLQPTSIDPVLEGIVNERKRWRRGYVSGT